MSSKKQSSKKGRGINEELESGLSTSSKYTTCTDLPQKFEESFTVRKPLGLRIHKTTLRITYIENNSVLVNRAFVGDKVIALNGQEIQNTQELNKILAGPQPVVVVKFQHAYFSFCQYICTTVERLQLDKEVFKSTGRAIDLFSVYLKVPLELDETRHVLKCSVRYDPSERVQIAQIDSSGIASIHLKTGDIIREVNQHPIASKTMLRHWICDAIEKGQMVQLSVERVVNVNDANRDQFEAPSDVVEIAQKQIQEIKAKSAKAPSISLVRSKTSCSENSKKSSASLKLVEPAKEVPIPSDCDMTKLKPCKMAKN